MSNNRSITPLTAGAFVVLAIIVIIQFLAQANIRTANEPTPPPTHNYLATLAVQDATQIALEAQAAGITLEPDTNMLEWMVTRSALTTVPLAMLAYCNQVAAGTRTPDQCREWVDGIIETNRADVFACWDQSDIGACLQKHDIPLP